MSAELFVKCGCTACGNHIEFPADLAGASIPCPHCGQQTHLSFEAPRSEVASTAELLAGFTAGIRRTRVSPLYQLGLIGATAVMLLLPIIYVGMIAAAAWGVYEYATHALWLFTAVRGSLYVWLLKAVAYVAPLFAGVVLVLFMIKPLFARRSPAPQPLGMNPALQPALYAVIARICELVGAPMPSHIYLDCNLNAGAGFRRGAVFSKDLVLTIGLPLVAGLSLREFVGVVAHEFGHFSQGFGMRLSYLVRRINFWFARVVYERDAWDVSLDAWCDETEDWRVMLVALCARCAVGVSRTLLLVLMYLGHGVSCFLLRQMEYDADSYEIKIAGSESFESAIRRLANLSQGLDKAYKDMRATWHLSRKLPDDLPAWVVECEAKVAPAVKQRIQDTIGLRRTGLFDTHPSDADRIRRARKAAEPGVFVLDGPASQLFSHFQTVSRQVTQLHYQDDLGLNIDASNLRVART